jgi:hypothetical protein
VDRIISTTRQLRQGEQHARHLRSWVRVLEDLQRGANAAAVPEPVSTTITGPAVGRPANIPGQDDSRAREAPAQAETQAYPRRTPGRRYFMSGGRSASINRRRRLR